MENLSASSSRISEKRLPVVGKYRLLAEIGHGGMAEVFLAVMEGPAKFSKLIALKMLRSQFAEDPEGREMFLNEARLAARLNHPNVVQTYEVGEIEHRYFIAMEYLEGQPFSRILHRARSGEHQALPLALSLRIIADSLSGLQYAHDLKDFDGSPLNLVHRDISPHNLFVTYDGSVKVLDFGIAKAAGSSAETRTGVLKGKVGYMAPEQISDLPLDRRVDVYATGIMLWEAVAGRKVWKGLSDVATLSKVATEGVPAITTAVPDLDPELARIVNKACARARDQRYASASDLQGDLEAYIEKMKDGAKATTRGISKWVSEVFHDMREETKHLVETQLTKAKSIPPEGFPSVRLPATMSLGSGDAPLSSTGSGSQPRAHEVSTGSGNVSVPAPQAAPPRGNKIVIGAIVVVATLVIGFLALRTEKNETPTSPTPGAAAGSALVVVNANPADAKISFDGKPLSSGRVFLPKDGKSHVVHIERDGYLPKDEAFLLDGDKTFNVALIAKPAEAPNVAPPPVATTTAPTSAKPATPTKPGKATPPTTATATATAAPPPPPPATTTAPTTTSTKKKIDEENPFNP